MNSTTIEKKLQASLLSNKVQEETLAYIRKLEKQISDASWVTNPDRMGGAFTEDELRTSSIWR